MASRCLPPAMCPDINECEQDNGGCSQICYNHPGSFHCACYSGYALAPNSKTCQGTEVRAQRRLLPLLYFFSGSHCVLCTRKA